MEAGTRPTSEQIEQEIGELLERETFEPPQEFAENAVAKARAAIPSLTRPGSLAKPSPPRSRRSYRSPKPVTPADRWRSPRDGGATSERRPSRHM